MAQTKVNIKRPKTKVNFFLMLSYAYCSVTTCCHKIVVWALFVLFSSQILQTVHCCILRKYPVAFLCTALFLYLQNLHLTLISHFLLPHPPQLISYQPMFHPPPMQYQLCILIHRHTQDNVLWKIHYITLECICVFVVLCSIIQYKIDHLLE